MNYIIIIQIILLFINCIIGINIYNNSHCIKESIKCDSYLLPDNVDKTVIKKNKKNYEIYHGIINDMTKVNMNCSSIESKNTISNNLKFITTVFVIIGTFALSLYIIIEDEYGTEFSDIIMTILITITNIIIFSFIFIIYIKCFNEFECEKKTSSFLKNKGVQVSCSHEIAVYNITSNIYQIILFTLIISMLIIIYNILSLTGYNYFKSDSFL
jgi:hypothetical protein